MKEIKMQYDDFIKKYILPNEDKDIRLKYYEGNLEFDKDYLLEIAAYNNIVLLTKKNKKTMQLNEFKDKLGNMLGDKHINIPSEKSIINRVDDGFNFFNSGLLEELTTDKRYYVQAFMDYIEELESKLTKLKKREREGEG